MTSLNWETAPDARRRSIHGPYDDRGRKVPRDCPRCGYGKLQYEGHGIWRCDGLDDPGHDDQPLVECEFTHEDGKEYTT
jgi:hypothetical protein